MLIFTEISAAANNFSVTGLEYVVDASLKAALILLVLSCCRALPGYKSSSAAARHFVLCTAFFSLLLIPFISVVLPAWRITLPQQLQQQLIISELINKTEMPSISSQIKTAENITDQRSDILNPSSTDASAGENKNDDATTPTQSSIPQSSIPLFAWPLRVLLIYLTGVILLLIRRLTGIIKVRRIIKQSFRITDPAWINSEKALEKQMGIRHRVEMCRSFDVPLPLTFGFRRPVILLPVTCPAWSESRRRTVLLHEFAHIKRKDWIVQGISQIVCAFYWFNPFVWLAVRSLRLEAEHACDDIVLANHTKASDYAGDLLDFARAQSPYKAAVAIAHQTHLEKRLHLILDSQAARRPLSIAGKIYICVIFAALILPIATAQLSDREKGLKDTEAFSLETAERQNHVKITQPDRKLSAAAQAAEKDLPLPTKPERNFRPNTEPEAAEEKQKILSSSSQRVLSQPGEKDFDKPALLTAKSITGYPPPQPPDLNQSTSPVKNKRILDDRILSSGPAETKSNITGQRITAYTKTERRSTDYSVKQNTIENKKTFQKFSRTEGVSPK